MSNLAKQKSKSSGIFALYAGEKNLADGTLEEISQQTGRSVTTLRCYLTPSYIKQSEKWDNAIRLIKLYEEGEEENEYTEHTR